MNLRPCTLDDIPTLNRMEEACFADPWTDDMLREELSASGSVFVMLEDTQPIGYYSYMHYLDEAQILNVSVLPEHQGRGYGKALMAHLLAHLPTWVTSVTLEVRVSNAVARRLYEGAGFVSAGIRPGYYMDGEDACIYWWHRPAAE